MPMRTHKHANLSADYRIRPGRRPKPKPTAPTVATGVARSSAEPECDASALVPAMHGPDIDSPTSADPAADATPEPVHVGAGLRPALVPPTFAAPVGRPPARSTPP